MAPMRNILLTVILACFFGGGLSFTNQVLMRTENYAMSEMRKDIQDLSGTVKAQALLIKQQALLIDHQTSVIHEQAMIIQQLQETDRAITSRMVKLESVAEPQQVEIIQNNTIEERVTLLEIQMTVAQEDITELNQDVTGLDENVEFLFDEQVIQDERILTLEQDSDQIEDEVESLQVTTLTLEFQVTVLENRTNSSEMRVETLEETAVNHETRITEAEGDIADLQGTGADQETRLTSAEEDIQGLQGTSDDQETRLTSAEENIQALQSTDLDHEARITSLEEYETIAFHAVLTSYTTIPIATVVEFNEIVLNEGNGYDGSTGIFTVPSGGSGLYYFSTYLLLSTGEWGRFDMKLNDGVICSAHGDASYIGSADHAQAACSAVIDVQEGDEVKVVFDEGLDDTPLIISTSNYFNGFNGFRI